jgi:hypothetical protein
LEEKLEMRHQGAWLGVAGLTVGLLLGAGIGYSWGSRRALEHPLPESSSRRRRVGSRLEELLAALGLGELPDERLAQRVRAAVVRAVSNPMGLSVAAESGRITLAGTVRRRELEPLLRAAAGVRGVREIENLLTVRDRPRRQGLPGTH